ncbi:class I SAM-dependent methyltransferase [Caulobacter sp. 17J65-9]|uniref:class I SAM-dependent methyltransferase n=1 Tax=Caulobacter sp. 17J65-9 TaxID=2709382 RepID=UPI0013CC501B|nr:class I SAM-dependent methyltransferase [Caulobacter sp. 17J65-9]NEX94216.1 class I SAM-dependent methyltransferase [Caulobacter sp. 17J65-9]
MPANERMIMIAAHDQAAVDERLAVLQAIYAEHGVANPTVLLAPAWALLSPIAGTREPPHAPRALFAAADLLAEALTRTHPGGARANHARAMRGHICNVAERAGVTPELLLASDAVAVEPPVLSEALVKIALAAAEIARLSPAIGAIPTDMALPAAVVEVTDRAEARLEGWCTREKSEYLARAVLSQKPEVCVEIGIYGGRSLAPCAAALRENGIGKLWGIESWSPQASLEFSTHAVNDVWWRDVDYARIKREFLRFLVDEDLVSQVGVVEATSQRAIGLFDRIDFLHVDGGHSTYGSAEDVVLYVRKVATGGVIVFDDVNWASTRPAQGILAAVCEPIHTFHNEAGEAACIVYRKR